MRISSSLAALALCVALCVATAAAQAPGIAARFEAPEPLRVGDRRAITLVVEGVEASLPVLVTTAEQGTALEVVRGRLTRLDAEAPDAEPLRFPISAGRARAGDDRDPGRSAYLRLRRASPRRALRRGGACGAADAYRRTALTPAGR